MALTPKDRELLLKIGEQLKELKMDLNTEKEFTDKRFKDVFDKINGPAEKQLRIVNDEFANLISKYPALSAIAPNLNYEITLDFKSLGKDITGREFPKKIADSLVPILNEYGIEHGKISIVGTKK